MGSFNNWVKGTYLELPENRHVVDVANQIMMGTAYLYRIQNLKIQGLQIPNELTHYSPKL